MNEDGLGLACRFSLEPNKLGYCGATDSWSVFLEYLQNRGSAAGVRKKFESFYALMPYLRLIARENGISDPLDERVVEAYWLGNKLLDSVSEKAIAEMIRTKLCGKGLLPKSFAEKLAGNVPKGALAHHSFQVLYVHFITGRLPWTLQNANRCLPKWGKIISTKGSKAVVGTFKVAQKRGKYVMLPAREVVESSVCGWQTAECKKGALVATHWGLAVKTLNSRECARLQKYTRRTLTALSENYR
ncbi:MAG: DUF6390 family protein [Candidatus Micrarchaeia archaeon]|jgi:hypothetical protein